MKERLIQLIADAGYDTITAAEIASRYIAEFKASGSTETVYVIGRTGACVRLCRRAAAAA